MSLSEQVRALECDRDRLRARVIELERQCADLEPRGQVNRETSLKICAERAERFRQQRDSAVRERDDLSAENRRIVTSNNSLQTTNLVLSGDLRSMQEKLDAAEKRAELFRLQRESLRAQIESHAKNCTGKKGDIVDTITITQRDNAGKLTCEGCPQLQRSGCARGWSDRVLRAGGTVPDYFVPGDGRCYGPGIFDVVQRPLEEMLEAWEKPDETVVETFEIRQTEDIHGVRCDGCPQLGGFWGDASCRFHWTVLHRYKDGPEPYVGRPDTTPGRICYGPGRYKIVKVETLAKPCVIGVDKAVPGAERSVRQTVELAKNEGNELRPESITGAAKKLVEVIPLAVTEESLAQAEKDNAEVEESTTVLEVSTTLRDEWLPPNFEFCNVCGKKFGKNETKYLMSRPTGHRNREGHEGRTCEVLCLPCAERRLIIRQPNDQRSIGERHAAITQTHLEDLRSEHVDYRRPPCPYCGNTEDMIVAPVRPCAKCGRTTALWGANLGYEGVVPGTPPRETSTDAKLAALRARRHEADVENQRLYEELLRLTGADDDRLTEEDECAEVVDVQTAATEALARSKEIENAQLRERIEALKQKGGE